MVNIQFINILARPTEMRYIIPKPAPMTHIADCAIGMISVLSNVHVHARVYNVLRFTVSLC